MINRVDRTIEISLQTKDHQESPARELSMNEIRNQLNRAGLTETRPNQELYEDIHLLRKLRKHENFCDWCYISHRGWPADMYRHTLYQQCYEAFTSNQGSCKPCSELHRPCTFTPTALLEPTSSMWTDAAARPRVELVQSVPPVGVLDESATPDGFSTVFLL